MAATAFGDLVNKSPVYAAYMQALLPEKISLVASGVASINPNSDVPTEFGRHGGKTFSIPFYKEITTAEELLVANTDLSITGITTGADIGVVCARGKALGSEDIAAIFAGDDPMMEIARQNANYWGRKIDTALFKVLLGAVGALGSTHQYTTQSANNFAYEYLIEAQDLLGDNGDQLSIVVMHSRIYNLALKLKIITPALAGATQMGAGGEILNAGFIGNKRVVVTDQVNTSGSGNSKIYSTYLCAPGAMSLFYQKNLKVEPYRLPLLAGGTDSLVSTVHFVPHLNFVKWTGTAASTTPSNTELGTTSNWASVADNVKNIRAIELQTLGNLV